MADEFRITPFRFGLNTDAVEETFARLIYEPWGSAACDWAPAVDVFETDQSYLISVEIPGVPAEAVEIRAEGTLLTISGQRRSMRVSQSSRAVRLERTWGRFSRTLQLGCPVDVKRMEVHSEDGVLHVRLPKVTGSPPAKPQALPHRAHSEG